MKFGMRYSNTGEFRQAERAVELVQAGERAGFESAWTVEHILIPPTYESKYPYTADGRIPSSDEKTYLPDPMMWMMYCAAHTTTIRFGTAVMILPVRNPVLLAKEAATFDALSGGRLMLGMGVGWLEEEFAAMGVPFARRGARANEYIDLMRYLWGSGGDPVRGEFDLTGINLEPKPVNGTIPIHIGGDSEAAATRAGTRGDGYFPARELTPALVDAMKRAADAAGRDHEEIELTVSMPDDVGELERLAGMGVDRVAVPVTGRAGLNSQLDSLAELEDRWAPIIEEYADL
jgi:probable F420-dependent oxidoreductase